MSAATLRAGAPSPVERYWLDHTALGHWAVTDEIAYIVFVIEWRPKREGQILLCAPGGDFDRWPLIEALWAWAGLESYPALIAEHCKDLGLQAREWVCEGGRP